MYERLGMFELGCPLVEPNYTYFGRTCVSIATDKQATRLVYFSTTDHPTILLEVYLGVAQE